MMIAAANANDLLKTLQAATGNGEGYFDALWQLFLKGELYGLINRVFGLWALLPLGIWLVNFLSNKQRDPKDGMLSTGDMIDYVLLGVILYGLAAPQSAANLLYDSKLVFFRQANQIASAAGRIAKDPATGIELQRLRQDAIILGKQACDRIGDNTERESCLSTLEKENQLPISDATNFDSIGLRSLAPDPLKLAVEGLLLSLGTVFLLLLEVAQILCCLFFSATLLFSIADKALLFKWLKAFISAGLIHTSYNIVIITIAFAMQLTKTFDSTVWAIVVGFGAPWLAIESISGNRFGILNNAAAAIGRVAGSLR